MGTFGELYSTGAAGLRVKQRVSFIEAPGQMQERGIDSRWL